MSNEFTPKFRGFPIFSLGAVLEFKESSLKQQPQPKQVIRIDRTYVPRPAHMFLPELKRQKMAISHGLASVKCVGCPAFVDIDNHNFRDDISVAEFNMSGLCQACQDGVFNGGRK